MRSTNDRPNAEQRLEADPRLRAAMGQRARFAAIREFLETRRVAAGRSPTEPRLRAAS